MKKIDKYFWIKSDPNVKRAYCYSFVYNKFHVLPKIFVFSLRKFYKL